MYEDNNKLKKYTGDEVSLLPLLMALFRHRWLVILFIIVATLIGGVLSKVLYKKMYTVESYVLLQSPRKVSELEQFRNDSIIRDTVRNTYEVVLKTNQLLERVVLSQYEYTADGQKKKTNLLTYYNTNNISTAIQKVKNTLALNYNKNTYVLTFSYTEGNAEITAGVTNGIVREFDRYYNTQFNATSQRNLEFVTKSLDNARKELDDARNALSVFINTNKQLKDISKQKNQYTAYYSSELAMQKLEENVEAKNKVYSELKKNYEHLRLQVAENAPTITVLEKALPPEKPIPCKYVKSSFIGGFAGLLIAFFYVFVKNIASFLNLKTDPFKMVLSELKKDIKSINIFKSNL